MINWNEIKGKIDKKAVYQTICLLFMSWGAFPIIYFMLVKKHKNAGRNKKEEEVK